MRGLTPLLSTGLTDVQLLAAGFAVGVAIVVFVYLAWKSTQTSE